VIEAAVAALGALLAPEEGTEEPLPPPQPAAPAEVSRRRLLRGSFGS